MSQPTTTEDVHNTDVVVHEKPAPLQEEKPNPCDETNVEASEQPNAAEEVTDVPAKLDKDVPEE